MGNATVSSSGKSNNGTLHSLGGDAFDDYYGNLVALYEGDVELAEDVLREFRAVIAPAGSMGSAVSNVEHGFAGANHQPREGAGNPPGNATVCPTHGQEAKYVSGTKNGKAYAFWKCPVNDSIISNFNGPGLKSACPAPK